MNDTTCQHCNNNNTRKRSKFCSEYCRERFKCNLNKNQTCLNCTKKRYSTYNYCKECYFNYRAAQKLIENKCQYCEKSLGFNHNKKFCSAKCTNKAHYWRCITNGKCTCGEKLVKNLTSCEKCRNMRKKYKENKPRPLEKQIFNSAKARAKRRKLPIDINLEDIIVPEYCPVLGIKLSRGNGKSQPNSPSLDRIKPELGYVKTNIKIISHKANTIKNNSTIEEIELVLDYMKSHND